jgi:DNA-directed RNA polymerase alpha subunit
VAAIKAAIPAGARQMPLAATQLPERILRLLTEAEFQSVGEVMEQLAMDENRILDLEGFGQKELEELKKALEGLTFPEPAPQPEPEPVEPAPAAEPEPEMSALAEVEAVRPEPESGLSRTAEAAELTAEAAVAEAPEALEEIETEEEEEEDVEDLADKDEEEELEDGSRKKGKKKSKKKGAVEITFDEDLGIYVTRKKRKPGRLKDYLDGTE